MAITRCGMALAAWGPSRLMATPAAPREAWLLTRAATSRCQTVAARSRISNRLERGVLGLVKIAPEFRWRARVDTRCLRCPQWRAERGQFFGRSAALKGQG